MPKRRRRPLPKLTYRKRQRVLSKIERRDDGCWIWQGSLSSKGQPLHDKRPARRMIYSMFKPLDKNEVVYPVCETGRLCVNPDHAALDRRRPRERCHRGHLFTDETTVWLRSGKRTCRICLRETTRARQERYAAAGKPYRLRSVEWYERRGLPVPEGARPFRARELGREPLES